MKTLMWCIAVILLLIAGAVSSNSGAGAEGAPTVPTNPNSIGDTDGEMANGQKNGDGTIFFGMIYGKGKFTFTNGDEYDGELLFGKPHGEGKMKWADGDIYVGQSSEGKMHGKGKYTGSNGFEYVGDYAKGYRHGTGTFTSMWQLYRYQGGWSYCKKHGKGVEAWFWNYIEFEVEYEDGQLVHRSLRFASLFRLIVRVIILLYLMRHHSGLVLVLLYFWIGRM